LAFGEMSRVLPRALPNAVKPLDPEPKRVPYLIK
jgi:hypothetical protein